MGNAEHELAPGDWFAGYLIESVAGRGGMGIVYRARQTRPDRLVAIKVISADVAQDEWFRACFEREISLAPEIEHPNVIPVYQVGEENGQLFIVMRFVEGRDLSDLCDRRGPFAAREAARLLTQIAQALDAAHARGVVHRDVKAANVLVTGADHEEHLYLTDFGIAKRIAEGLGLTATGMFVGTIDYISPEQIRGKDVDARSDIYSLGCVLYELLVGAVPFAASEEVLPRMLAHANGDTPPPPSSLAPDVCVELDSVVARAMAASPDDRFLSACDLARATVAAATGGANLVPERSVATGRAAFREPAPPSPPADGPGPVGPLAADDGSSAPAPSPIARLSSLARRRPWHAAGLTAAIVGLCAMAIAQGHDGADGDDVISADAIANAKGTVTYCTGRDVVTSRTGRTRQHQRAINDFNNDSPGLTARLNEFPEDATERYERFNRDLASDHDCDVFYSDVTWTADFAHNKWLHDLSPYYEDLLPTFVPAMRDAAVFENKTYGVPKQADAGLLYYRTDRVVDPPTTWQELYEQASAPPTQRLRYQALDYEGLTVAFLELAYAAGADDIVTPQGRANLKQVPAYVALQLMVDGIRKTRAVPRAIVDQKEEENLRAFGRGKADFLRNWPYAFSALQDSRRYPNVAGRVGVVALPRWDTKPAASVLGGHVLVVSASSKNPAAALKLVKFLTSERVVKRDATAFSLAPALEKLWIDDDVREALPAFEGLKKAVFNAKSRPVTPNYEEVSEAISKNVNRALRGQTPSDSALDAANAAMQQALDEVDG